jgi:hypothetical protein
MSCRVKRRISNYKFQKIQISTLVSLAHASGYDSLFVYASGYDSLFVYASGYDSLFAHVSGWDGAIALRRNPTVALGGRPPREAVLAWFGPLHPLTQSLP